MNSRWDPRGRRGLWGGSLSSTPFRTPTKEDTEEKEKEKRKKKKKMEAQGKRLISLRA